MALDRKLPVSLSSTDGRAKEKDALSELLDFGPESAEGAPPESASFNERVRRLVKQLEELKHRMDRLNNRL